MDTRRALLVDAFTTDPLSGNPAGLVPDADGLADEAMAAIARELHASETAFLLDADGSEAARRLRYFTPTGEIDLCGHATVAAGSWLADAGDLEDGTYTFETNAGSIEIDLEGGLVRMTPGEEVSSVSKIDLGYDRVASAIGADPATLADVGADLPLATASMGPTYLLVPVNFLEALSGLEPDSRAIAELTEELGVTGVYAFTFDALEADSTLHGRMFAPAVGVDEDPVTGTASGAVGAYLREVEAFDGELPAEMVFEQGHFLDRPGRVRVQARTDPVSIGGRAVTAFEGTMSVPEMGEDDIIEI